MRWLVLCFAVARRGGAALSARRVAARVPMAVQPQSTRRGAFGLAAGALVAPGSVRAEAAIMPEYATCRRLPREIIVNTPAPEKTATFLTLACSMRIVDESPGRISLAFGPTQLDRPADFIPGVSPFDEDGGHLKLTLVESPAAAEAGDVAYIQFALDYVRASFLMKYGGEIVQAYGAIDVNAPVRDRAMYVALRVSEPRRSADFYVKTLGMRVRPYPRARKLEGALDPDPPKGSVYLDFCDDSFGILLLQSKRDFFGNPAKPALGGIYSRLRVADLAGGGGAKAATFADPDGFLVEVGSVL